jgi:hypothetical protein
LLSNNVEQPPDDAEARKASPDADRQINAVH